VVSKKLVIALNTFLLCISGSPVYAQQIQRDTGRPVDQKVIEKQLERKLADALTRGDVSEAARVQQQLKQQQIQRNTSRPVDQRVIEKQLERKLADALTRGDVSEAARVKQQLQEQQARQKASALVKILVEIDGVAPLQIEGSKKQVTNKIKKLETEAIALAQAAVAGDKCRATICTTIQVDEKTGNSIERPLTVTEVAIEESKTLIKAIQQIELVKLAQKQNSGVQMIIPISVDGVKSKISGTAAQIASQLTELQQKAAEKQIDPCAAGGCTKVIVNATTGVTNVVPLSVEDLAQRKIDMQERATSARKMLEAAAKAEPEPSLTLSVQTPNQSISTSGTRAQLEEFVQTLEKRATEYKSQNDPCAAGGCTKVEVNATTGVTTVSPLSAADLAQRATDRAAEATRAADAAKAARESLGSAEPTLTLSVQTPNQGFGTSGTRSQLEQVVKDLEKRAAAAAETAKQPDPCAAGGCTKVEVNATTGVTTVSPLSAAELAQRATDRAAEANRSAELATAARESLDKLP